MPGFTSCKGEIEIRTAGRDNDGRFVVVSFWDYPTVNDIGGEHRKGEVVINEIVVSESKTITVDFPTQMYTIVWTPALGTQHIAPEPGIMIFSKDYLPSWNVGGTEPDLRICCGPPRSNHEFKINLINSEEFLSDEKGDYGSIELLEEFMDKRGELAKKMRKYKGLTETEQAMVFEKLAKTAAILEITE